MKALYKIALIFVCAGLISCENFLDKSPQGVFNEEAYYQTPEEIKTGVTYCYQALWKQTFQAGKFMIGNMMSDDATKGGATESEGIEILHSINYNILPHNNMSYRVWNDGYLGLTRANFIADIIGKRSFTLEEPSGYDLRLRLLAEVQFLRAYFSYFMVMTFGDIPYYTRPTNSNITTDLYESKNRELIWNQIILDLEEAIPNLPKRAEYEEGDVGRVTRGAAQALLAKALMFNKKYDDAITVLEELINNDSYILLDSYHKIFLKENVYSQESLFEIPFGEQEFWRTPGEGGWGTVMCQFQTSRDDGGWGYNNPTQDLVDEFETGDPRLIYTIIYENDEFEKSKKQAGNAKYGYHNRKMFLPKAERNPDYGNVDHHLRIFRLADMYLLYSEALLLSTSKKDITKSLFYLNEVRKRANNTPKIDPMRVVQEKTIEDVDLPMITHTDDNQLLEAIKHERRVELAMEDIRYWDLLRWDDIDIMKEYYSRWGNGSNHPDLVAPNGFADEKGLDVEAWLSKFPANTYPVFPIPQNSIINSDNKIKQSNYY